jgi:hypothetical protein
MTYVVGLFHDRPAAQHAADRLNADGLSYVDHEIKEHEPSVKGWVERVFGMIEPLSTLQAEGVEHEDARWYADRMERGDALMVVRSEDAGQPIAKALRDDGAELVRIYSFESGRWVRTVVDEIGAPPPR